MAVNRDSRNLACPPKPSHLSCGKKHPGNTFDEQWKYGFTKSANRNRQYRKKQGRFLQRGLVCTAYPPQICGWLCKQQYWTDIRSPAQPSGFCGCFDNIFCCQVGRSASRQASPIRTWQGRKSFRPGGNFSAFHYLLVDSLGSPGQAAF